jgi:transposase
MSEKFCGVDVHKKLLVATILDGQNQEKQTKKFQNNQTDITNLKTWLKQNQCLKIVMESTSIFWVTLYLMLEEANLKPILANAYMVKNMPGRKTDQSDSEWLAYLLRANLIKPSYVPPKHIRELRELTRMRTKYVQNQTQFKNRVHSLLSRANFCLSSKLSDVFGKAGQEILDGLMEGKSVGAVLEETKNEWLLGRREEFEEVVLSVLSENDCFLLKQLTESLLHLKGQIAELDAKILSLVCERELDIVCSVPGVGKTSGAVILAELGDPLRFGSEKQVAAWSGMVPGVYQSAGKVILGSITKRGSSWLRRIMVEVAHTAVRVKGSRFKRMFLRIEAKKGSGTAYVAVARKLLTVIWHLLAVGELYVEEGVCKKRVKLRSGRGGLGKLSLDAIVGILRDAECAVSSVDVDVVG